MVAETTGRLAKYRVHGTAPTAGRGTRQPGYRPTSGYRRAVGGHTTFQSAPTLVGGDKKKEETIMKTYTKAYIQSLLDKYLDGLTSLEEERLLGEYFRTQSVPPEWEDYREMFAWFDDGMKGKYLQDDNGINNAETASTSIPPKRSKMIRLTLPWLAAACLAGGLIWGIWPKQHSSQSLTVTIDKVCEQQTRPSLKEHAALRTESKENEQPAVTPVTSDQKSTPHVFAATHSPTKMTTISEKEISIGHQDSLLLAQAQHDVDQWQIINDSAKADHSLLMANLLETKAMIAQAHEEIAQAKRLIDSEDKQQHYSPYNIIEL